MDDMLMNGPIWSPQWIIEDPPLYEPVVTFTSDTYGDSTKAIYRREVCRFDPLTGSFKFVVNEPYINECGDLISGCCNEEDISKMKVEEYREDGPNNSKYAVACHIDLDLSSERVLKTLSIMKGKLMTECMPVRIVNIKCKMSPIVKNNIINAYRKVTMYGKKTPFVARFDDYGRRLPDEIKIDTMKGVDLEIVDPEIYGENCLIFEAILACNPKDYIFFTVKKKCLGV